MIVNYYNDDTEVLEYLLSHVDLEERDFVFYNGDMMTHINSEEHMFKGFMDKTVELFASHKPFYFARGNHETRGPFSTRFMDYFPTHPENLISLFGRDRSSFCSWMAAKTNPILISNTGDYPTLMNTEKNKQNGCNKW